MKILNKFLEYIAIDTTSNSKSSKRPSSLNQMILAKKIFNDLQKLNIDNIWFDQKNCYVYGMLKGNKNIKSIGFISHLDTSEDEQGKDIKTNIIKKYDGSEIRLNQKKVLSPKDYPDLNNHIGQTLITTRGETLLGSDDKAGIVEIINMIEYYSKNKIEHGDIYICFTPDEEIGCGIDNIDFEKFKPEVAYTVDGSTIGEISYENFNAATANIEIKGIPIHYGSAKGKMINSLLISNKINNMLPNELPENTDEYEGLFHLKTIVGDVSNTKMCYLIRDFTKEGFKKRKEQLNLIISKLNKEYNNCIILEIKDTCYNMKEIIEKNYECIELVFEAMKKSKIEPQVMEIRGGTDGAVISFKGIPCPNIGAGGHNFHSVYEYITVEDMEKVSELLINIVKCYAKKK